ncbi:hypothetical protein CB1_000649003 [Camelus ferus]|nr:hypothetical protein CB1_000649003 [Camelus ferus]
MPYSYLLLSDETLLSGDGHELMGLRKNLPKGQCLSGQDHLLKASPSPRLRGGPAGGGRADIQQKEGAEDGHRPVPGVEGDLKGVTGDAGRSVPLPVPKRNLERPKAGKAQGLQGRISRLRSVADHLLKASPSPRLRAPRLRGGPVDGGRADIQQKEGAEDGHRPVHGAEGDLKGVTGDAGRSVRLPRPQEEHQGTARRLREEKQMIQELTAQVTSLQTEEASVKGENSRLDGEIEQLKLKLQSLPDAYDDCVTQLHRELSQVEARCLQVEKQLTHVCRDLDSTRQMRDLCKKMAQDAGEELERTTSYHLKKIHFQEKRAGEGWLAAVATKKKLQEL